MSTTPETVEDKTPAMFAEVAKQSAEVTARNNDLLAQLLEEQRAARLERETAKQPAPQKEQEYTQEQLEAWVESGQITKAAMTAQLVKQGMKVAVAQITAQARAEATAERAKELVTSKLEKYRAEIPAVLVPGSPERELLTAKFKELVAEGQDPNDMRTELNALRAAFPEKKKAAPVRETTRETHRSTETVGSRGEREDDDRAPSQSGMKWPDYVPDDQRAFYEKEIEKGRYRGPDDPDLKEELSYIKRNAAEGRRRRAPRGGRAA